MLKSMPEKGLKFNTYDEAQQVAKALHKSYARISRIMDRVEAIWIIYGIIVLLAALTSVFMYGGVSGLVLLPIYWAWLIIAQVKIAVGEERGVVLAYPQQVIYAMEKRLYVGRFVALMVVQLAVCVGAAYCVTHMRTNFTTDDLAYNKEAKEFVAVGAVDWLPEARYTIVDMELVCDMSYDMDMLFDVDKDGAVEHRVRACYGAEISAENWKKYVARAVDGGDTMRMFDFCDVVDTVIKKDFGRDVSLIKGVKREDFADLTDKKQASEFVSSLVTEYFAERGINLKINVYVDQVTVLPLN